MYFLAGIQQHDHEDEENHDCPGVDDDLYGGDKLSPQHRAISTAKAAARSTSAWVSASVEAKPHPPPAITRMPKPKDCDSLTWEVCPFLVEI